MKLLAMKMLRWKMFFIGWKIFLPVVLFLGKKLSDVNREIIFFVEKIRGVGPNKEEMNKMRKEDQQIYKEIKKELCEKLNKEYEELKKEYKELQREFDP